MKGRFKPKKKQEDDAYLGNAADQFRIGDHAQAPGAQHNTQYDIGHQQSMRAQSVNVAKTAAPKKIGKKVKTSESLFIIYAGVTLVVKDIQETLNSPSFRRMP